MQTDMLAPLRKASEGLIFRSESEAPFTPFSWGKADGDLTPDKVARLAHAKSGVPVEEETLADFFKNLVQDGGDDAAKYRALQQALGKLLAGARVFRVGNVEIDVYIVGRTADGNWAGLKTQSVET